MSSLNNQICFNFISCNVWSEGYAPHRPSCVLPSLVPVNAKAQQTALDIFSACENNKAGNCPHAIALQECTKPFADHLVIELNKKINDPNLKYELTHANHKLSGNFEPRDGLAVLVLMGQGDQIKDRRTAWFPTEKEKERAALVVDVQFGPKRLGGKCVRFGSFHADGNPHKPDLGDQQTLNTLSFFNHPEQFGLKKPIQTPPDCIVFGTDLNQEPNTGRRIQLIQGDGFQVDTGKGPTERITVLPKEIDFVGCKSTHPTQIFCSRGVNDQLFIVNGSDHNLILSQLAIEESRRPEYKIPAQPPTLTPLPPQVVSHIPAPSSLQSAKGYSAKVILLTAIFMAAVGFLAARIYR